MHKTLRAMMLIIVAVPAQSQIAEPMPIAPAEPTAQQRNDIVCLTSNAALLAQATDVGAHDGLTALVGYYLGRLRTNLSASELDAMFMTVISDGSLTRDLTAANERCGAEAIVLSQEVSVIARTLQGIRSQKPPVE